jgi:putative inorganic carbon (hco3(-)) transporter
VSAELGPLARPRPHPSLWAGLIAGGAAAFAAGGALAQAAQPVQLMSMGAIGVLGVAAAVIQLRWYLVATLLLLVTYIPDVLAGHHAAHALIALALAAALLRSASGSERLTLPRELLAFIPLLLACLAATMFAEDSGAAAAETLDILSYAVVVALLVTLLDSPAWVRRAVWAVVAGIGLLAVLASVQQLTKSYASTYGGLASVLVAGRNQMRSAGPLNPNVFGQVLVVAAVLAFYLALTSPRAPARILAAAIAGACLVATVYTQSRAALIALFVTVIVIGALRGVRPHVLALGTCGAVVLGLLVLPQSLEQRIGDLSQFADSTPATLQDTSLRGRTGENLAGFEMWADHPLIGVGPDNFEVRYPEYAEAIGLDPRPQRRSAHNLYLESLAETGLLGALPFFTLLGLALVGGWRARSRLSGGDALLGEGLFAALLAFLICAMTLNSSYARYEWIFLGLGLAVGRVARRPVA